MIRARHLSGRAVVDMDVAEKLGSVDKVILDPDTQRVAGFVVTRRPNVLANEVRITVPASAVHALGPEAITVHRSRAGTAADVPLQGLPSVGDLCGRKVSARTAAFSA